MLRINLDPMGQDYTLFDKHPNIPTWGEIIIQSFTVSLSAKLQAENHTDFVGLTIRSPNRVRFCIVLLGLGKVGRFDGKVLEIRWDW